MTALKDLLGSERGLIGLLLIICCTVLAAMNRMTFSDWQSYTMWIFGIYVGGKTITGAVQIAKGKTETDINAMSPTDMEKLRDKAKEFAKVVYGYDIDAVQAETAATKARTAEIQKDIDAMMAGQTPEPPKAA